MGSYKKDFYKDREALKKIFTDSVKDMKYDKLYKGRIISRKKSR